MIQIFKKNYFALFLILFLSLAAVQCSSPTGPSPNTNLLKDPSFENNGNASLTGWNAYTSFINFSNDVPPEGGKWSIFMYGYNPLSAQPILLDPINQKITTLKGSYVYSFSFWSKADSTTDAYGKVFAFRNDSLISIKSVAVTDSNWAQYFIIDSLSSTDADSLKIIFFGGASYPFKPAGKTYFDLCSLTAKEF